MSAPTPRRYRLAPGAKRHQVQIQEFAREGVDARGQEFGTWSTVATVWGNVLTLNGRIGEYARQLWEDATVRVLIDYRPDVTSDKRLVFSGRTFAIGYVINQDEGNHTLEILCTESRS